MLVLKNILPQPWVTILLLILYINVISIAFAENSEPKYYTLKVKVETIDSIKHLSVKSLDKLTEMIKADLLITRATQESKITKDRIVNLHSKAPSEILENLQSLGYYHATIIRQSLNKIDRTSYLANYQIILGKPTKIKEIDCTISGVIPPLLRAKLTAIITENLKVGAILNHDPYEKTKRIILNTLHDHGFLAADLKETKILIDLNTFSAMIKFTLIPNQQYYFGPVSFKTEQYKTDFLSKYIPFKEGDAYSITKLMQFKNNLLNSDLFGKVRIDIADPATNSSYTTPILARVYPKPANKYMASMGFGSDTGFRGKIGYLHRFHNLQGQQLNTSIAVTKPRKQAMVNYEFLGNNPVQERYDVGLIAQEEKIKTRLNKNFEAYFKKLWLKNYITKTCKLSFLHENFRELDNSPKVNAHFILPSLHLKWLNLPHKTESPPEELDDLAAINKNLSSYNLKHKLNLNLKFALKTMLSSSSLIQFNADHTMLLPLPHALNLIIKTQGGLTVIKHLSKLPLSLRFFAGGDNSVRGFSYNNLGPVAQDINGEYGIIGGKYLLFGSLQLEKTLPNYKEVALAGFIDCGNSFNHMKNFFTKQIAVGTGFGISYATPIGAFKAYLAKPIKLPKSNYVYKKHWRIHLTFVTDL